MHTKRLSATLLATTPPLSFGNSIDILLLYVFIIFHSKQLKKTNPNLSILFTLQTHSPLPLSSLRHSFFSSHSQVPFQASTPICCTRRSCDILLLHFHVVLLLLRFHVVVRAATPPEPHRGHRFWIYLKVSLNSHSYYRLLLWLSLCFMEIMIKFLFYGNIHQW